MLLNPHRVVRLIELAELEGRLTGPERILREEEVALFIKSAYDDATDAARAEFVAGVRSMAVSAWPWSAVQRTARPPLALVLLRGQAESADADPHSRIPERGRPEAAAWSPLHSALDSWDTAMIRRWITPRGWLVPAVRMSTVMTRPTSSPQLGASPGRLPGGGVRPGPGVQPGNGGVAPPGTGSPPPGSVQPPGGDVQPVDAGATIAKTWRHPAVLAAGATVLTTLGVALYSLGRSRGRALPSPPRPATTEAPKP